MKIISNYMMNYFTSAIKHRDECLEHWRNTIDLNSRLIEENSRLEKRLLESFDRIEELTNVNKELLSIIQSGIQVEVMTKTEDALDVCS